MSLSSDNPERFLPGATFYARPGRTGVARSRLPEQVPLTVESVRGDEVFPIVAFQGIEGRDRAEAFSGYVLEIRSSELPVLEEDEFYPFDVVGLEARDPSGSVVGRVTDALESPAHAILVVSLQVGAEALVPFVLPAVPVVDIEAGYLVVDPEFVSFAGVPSEGRPADAEGGDAGGPS